MRCCAARRRAARAPASVTTCCAPRGRTIPGSRDSRGPSPTANDSRVLDNRLYDLVPLGPPPPGVTLLAPECDDDGTPGDAVTMVEVSPRSDEAIPRILGVNHHPEIVNRQRQIVLLEKKRARGGVNEQWVAERLAALTEPIDDDANDLASAPDLELHADGAAPLRALPRGPPPCGRPRPRPRLRRAGSAAGLQPAARRLTLTLSRRRMIPKPPFAADLTLEQELEAFNALKPRLTEVWDALTAADDSHCTSVVVPSLTLDQDELEQAVRRRLLRGAAAVPVDSAAQSARARGLRDLAAGSPDDPRLLPEPAGRRAGGARPRAPDDAVLSRRLAAAADAEDHRAAAPGAAHPRRDARPSCGPT